jgi:hypothetical protein
VISAWQGQFQNWAKCGTLRTGPSAHHTLGARSTRSDLDLEPDLVGQIWGKLKVTMKMKMKSAGKLSRRFWNLWPKPDITPKFQNAGPIITRAKGPGARGLDEKIHCPTFCPVPHFALYSTGAFIDGTFICIAQCHCHTAIE